VIESTIIIVGGGPAGAACAWKLKQRGFDALILDKQPFPRQKICAGWITPHVLDLLSITPETYPFSMTRFNRIYFHLFGMKFPVRTRQYTIRRYEFDQWMVDRAQTRMITHSVKNIAKKDGYYTIDGQYRCRYLVGAGGTHCPVNRIFFNPTVKRPQKALIAALEREYRCDYSDGRCHLWFFDRNLPGYAWYLPKADGWLNIGIGGKFLRMKSRGKTIMDYWREFIRKLQRLSLIDGRPKHPKGHTYYLCHKRERHQLDNAYITGDAAGLSTLDLGEGIHAAVASGILAAEAIAGERAFKPGRLTKFSLPGIFMGK